jgi:hypothetical protein
MRVPLTLVRRADVVLNSDNVRQLRLERKRRVIFGSIVPGCGNLIILELESYQRC